MSVHRLKTTDRWWDRVAAGQKTAEIRKHDRDFQVGDWLELAAIWGNDGRHLNAEGDLEWHTKGRETGETVTVEVTHVLPAEHFPEGLQPGYCLLSFNLETNR